VVRKDKNAIFFSLFSGQVQWARKHAKSRELTAVFSSIYGFVMRPFAEGILFYFWKTQAQHFIARKQSSKPNARGKVRNNKH
jgi:hypothetical protein